MIQEAFKAYLEEAIGRENALVAFSAFEQPASVAVRMNPFKKCGAFEGEPVPWSRWGRILRERPMFTLDPHFHGGAYYVQDSSSMFVGEVFRQCLESLAVPAGRPVRVLDLCAAPGGKTTDLAASLRDKFGDGFVLVANEVMKQRAGVLASNVALWGDPNVVVTSDDPSAFAALEGFFDIVVADVPCSGEGMFRKNPLAIAEWSKEHVKMCAKRQLSILNVAAQALKAGGVLVYSTCTFSLEENEQTIYNFLKENKNFELEEINCDFGRHAFHIDATRGQIDTRLARRVFPQDGGEGHFIAYLRRKDANTRKIREFAHRRGQIRNNKFGESIFLNIFNCVVYGQIETFNDKWVVLPSDLPDISGLNVLRAGVLLATSKGSNFEPAHAAFMAAKPDEINQKIELRSASNEILAFLRGEEISIPEKMSGYVGVCVDGLTVGFGKAVNGRLKNKYPKGLRLLR